MSPPSPRASAQAWGVGSAAASQEGAPHTAHTCASANVLPPTQVSGRGPHQEPPGPWHFTPLVHSDALALDGLWLRPGSAQAVERHSRLTVAQSHALLAGADMGDPLEYNPNLLDDPQWPCGKHKRVLIFASYMVHRAALGVGGGQLRWATRPALGSASPRRQGAACRRPRGCVGTASSVADHGDRVREALRPQEGHERDLPGEVPTHQADAEQNQEVRGAEAGVPEPAAETRPSSNPLLGVPVMAQCSD